MRVGLQLENYGQLFKFIALKLKPINPNNENSMVHSMFETLGLQKRLWVQTH